MSEVVVGRVGDVVSVELDVCAKTGRRTTDRATLRGSTTPSWVLLLLLFTVVGFLLAQAMTSRRYEVRVPFVRDVHDRWVRNRRLAWVVGLLGVVCVVVVVAAQTGPWLVVAGIVLVVGAVVGGSVNGVRNGLGVSADRHGNLVLSWADRRFAEAVAEAHQLVTPAAS